MILYHAPTGTVSIQTKNFRHIKKNREIGKFAFKEVAFLLKLNQSPDIFLSIVRQNDSICYSFNLQAPKKPRVHLNFDLCLFVGGNSIGNGHMNLMDA